MDNRMKEKIRDGRLTRDDVRRMIDWQLTLESEKIDSNLLGECLLFLYPQEPALRPEDKEMLWNRIKAAAFGTSRVHRWQRHHRRASVRTILIAALLLLLLAGAAIAAVLGTFGRFTTDPMIEMSHTRLEHLDEVAETVGKTIVVNAPSGELDRIDLTTDYGRIQAQQYGRQFELTVDQVYCDGNKLYYSYQLSEKNRTFELLEGTPTGFEAWDWEEPGKKLTDTYWTPGATEEEEATAKAWFATHEQAYAIESYFGLGDGADLNDGSECGISLNIWDSGMEQINPYTKVGFQQVDLPEDYVPGETIDFLLTVMYSTEVVCQDESGVYRTGVRQKENRGFMRVPVTAKITGKPEEFVKTVQFDDYTAEVHLAISDVDISGMVYIDAPQEWIDAYQEMDGWADWVTDYKLIADGQEMPNVSGGYGIGGDEERWRVYIRYDLPQSTEHLTLVPYGGGRKRSEAENIVIR